MFLEELKMWNFRKYGEGENGHPGLILKFHKHFNLIIGENDSGKTAIIDAIKLTLGTSSIDNNKIMEKDFHVDSEGRTSKNIKIECKFSSLSSREAGMFLEWLTFNEKNEYELIVRFEASRNNTSFGKGKIYKSVKAGPENGDSRLEGLAYDLLSATYLKPLRDAENELTPGYKSRLAQILKNHPAFKVENNEDEHKLVEIVRKANEDIKGFFDEPFLGDRTIKSDLQDYLDDFFFIPTKGSENYEPDFQVSNSKLNDILRKLSLNLDETPTGLGSLNLLFIAAELLLYDDKTPGLS